MIRPTHDVFDHERAHATAAILVGVPLRGFKFGSTAWGDDFDGQTMIEPGVGTAEQLATIAYMPLVMLLEPIGGSAGDIETLRRLKPTEVSDEAWIRATKERAVALLDHPDFGNAYREATDRLLEAV
jgi:hypothetical protein